MRKKFKMSLKPFPVSLVLQIQDTLPEEGALGLTSKTDDGILVQVYDDLDDECKLNTCIHEAVHAIQFLEETVETTLDDESAAYWTAYIACWILEKAYKATKSS